MPREDQPENTRVPRMALHDLCLLVMGGQSHAEAEGASTMHLLVHYCRSFPFKHLEGMYTELAGGEQRK